MIFEISAIERGDGPDDLLVTVSYWHGNVRKPQRDPDFVEHHVLLGLPEIRLIPLYNELGQFLGVDGRGVAAWEYVEDNWVGIDPYTIVDRIQWREPTTEEIEAVITSPILGRAQAVADLELRGQDLYPDEQRPGLRRQASRKQSAHVRYNAASLVGRTGVV